MFNHNIHVFSFTIQFISLMDMLARKSCGTGEPDAEATKPPNSVEMDKELQGEKIDTQTDHLHEKVWNHPLR